MTRAIAYVGFICAVLAFAVAMCTGIASAASMLGFVVLRLGTGQVDHQHVTEIIDWLRKGVR